MIGKTISFVVSEVARTTITIDNHMAINQVQIGKNIIKNVLLDGGSRVNIIIEQLKLRLGLQKFKPTPYNLRMTYQITIKLVGLICDLKIHVRDIPYVIMFIVLQNNVIDVN